MTTANLFFSFLTLATNVALVSVLVLAVVARGSTAWSRLQSAALPMAAAVATVSMLGSLYYSEIAGLQPCRLCWYQRAAMYPLAILLLVALFTRRPGLWRFGLPLALIGAVISGYHYFIQHFPEASGEAVCDVDLPCTAVEMWELGFISLAYMALSAFLFVAAALWFGVRSAPEPTPVAGRRDAGIAVTATLALAGVLAVLLAPAPMTEPSQPSGSSEPAGEVAAPQVDGAPLPQLVDGPEDPAAGLPVPSISGTDYNGRPVTIPSEGAKIIMVVAHWCPHCQREVPEIQQWLDENGTPEGVELYSVSTAESADAPNYPPDEWLVRERWSVPVIADDELGTARAALGISGYPFFLFVAPDGTVLERRAGALPIEDFAQRVTALQATL